MICKLKQQKSILKAIFFTKLSSVAKGKNKEQLSPLLQDDYAMGCFRTHVFKAVALAMVYMSLCSDMTIRNNQALVFCCLLFIFMFHLSSQLMPRSLAPHN